MVILLLIFEKQQVQQFDHLDDYLPQEHIMLQEQQLLDFLQGK